MTTLPAGARVPPSWIPPCVVGGPGESDGEGVIEALHLLLRQISVYAAESPGEAWATIWRWQDYLAGMAASMDGLEFIEATMLLEDAEKLLSFIAPAG